MNDNIFYIFAIFGTIIITFGLVALLAIGDYLYESNIYCPNFGQNVGLEYKYNYWAGGCFVNYEGQWIRSNQLRAGQID
jgi:hypothetical protein